MQWPLLIITGLSLQLRRSKLPAQERLSQKLNIQQLHESRLKIKNKKLEGNWRMIRYSCMQRQCQQEPMGLRLFGANNKIQAMHVYFGTQQLM